MNKNEMMRLLSAASREIQNLRRRNEFLEGQMEVVRIFGRCSQQPETGGTMGVDVVWELDRAINEIGHSMAQEVPAEP